MTDGTHTPAEALELRCCVEGCGDEKRAAVGTSEIGRRYCVSVACMAWRWALDLNPDARPGELTAWQAGTPMPVARPAFVRSSTRGFCGRAGSAGP